MRPTRICLVLGLACVILGAAMALFAAEMATTWQYLGGGAWAAATYPHREWAYHYVGLGVLGLGLVLEALACSRWMGGPGGTS